MSSSGISTDSEALDYRIYIHKHFSKSDFDKWVIDNLNLKKGMRVIDLGCGTGKHLFEIGEKVGKEGEILGLDISDESLRKCQEKILENKVKNISVIKSDLTEIKEKTVQSGKFDRVLSSFAIYYTKNPNKTFKDILDLLKNGGEFFLCGPTNKNNLEFLELVKEAQGEFSEDFLLWSRFLEQDAKKILDSLFGEVKIQYFNNPVEFPDEETLFKYWQATPFFNVKIEKTMKEKMADKFSKNKTFISNKVIIGITCKKI
jgi:ubiquinone/menaquinone biosynthesis C-methylase UbiE